MSPFWITLIVIIVILIVACIVLYFLGKKAEKKQAEQKEQMDAVAQKPDFPPWFWKIPPSISGVRKFLLSRQKSDRRS